MLRVMSRLFQRRSDAARSELDELRKVLCRLRASDARVRFKVGAGVSLANSDFIRRFSGIESFRRMPTEARKRFCADLSDLELGLRGQELEMAIGVGLYRIWLTDATDDRQDLAELLGEALTELSRKAAGAIAANYRGA